MAKSKDLKYGRTQFDLQKKPLTEFVRKNLTSIRLQVWNTFGKGERLQFIPIFEILLDG